jgi:hypothetical protein
LTNLLFSTDRLTHGSLKFSKLQLEKDHLLIIAYGTDYVLISPQDETVDCTFKVCKSVHHSTIKINYQPNATIFPVYYPDVYLQLNMFRAFSRPSSGAQ